MRGFTVAMRARCACTSSTDEMARWRTRRAWRVAEKARISSMAMVFLSLTEGRRAREWSAAYAVWGADERGASAVGNPWYSHRISGKLRPETHVSPCQSRVCGGVREWGAFAVWGANERGAYPAGQTLVSHGKPPDSRQTAPGIRWLLGGPSTREMP